MARLCYVTTRGLFQFQAKHFGIICESEYWIGPSAELRIHHHLFVYNNNCVVDCFCFFIVILRRLFWYS